MNIVVNRGKTVSLEELPPYSIALDGFVQGPQIDNEHHRYSLDHHNKVLRYCTTSACMQAWTAVMMGLEDLDRYTLYANDVDSDVCVAIWCLKNPDRCNEPAVVKLVNAVGLADMHGGAISNNGMKKVVEWICAPETDSKIKDDYSKISDEGLNTIFEAVYHRIELYVNGLSAEEVSKRHKHSGYKILRNENDWVLVDSADTHIYPDLYQAGFNRLARIHTLPNGSIDVTLAKRSDFVDRFSLPDMYCELNKVEPPSPDRWNGGTTIGGAPRNPDGTRSRLSIDSIAEIINKCVLGS